MIFFFLSYAGKLLGSFHTAEPLITLQKSPVPGHLCYVFP